MDCLCWRTAGANPKRRAHTEPHEGARQENTSLRSTFWSLGRAGPSARNARIPKGREDHFRPSCRPDPASSFP